jgi:hypothetical protein
MIMEFTIAHENGAVWPEKLRIFCSGNDRDSKGNYSDKGAYKANTGGFKYFLHRLFMIDTGDDPEDDAPKSGAKRSRSPKPTDDAPNEPTQTRSTGTAHGNKAASDKQQKMLGARASAKADELLDAALEAGLKPEVQDRAGAKEIIRQLAKAHVGIGDEIKGSQVDALLKAIEACRNDDAGNIVLGEVAS